MDSSKLKPGDEIPPCTEAPTLRVKGLPNQSQHPDLKDTEGYTSRGYVSHFLPDREVNLAKLNKALADVFGEPALRMIKMELQIDEEFWKQICGDPWSGNIYRYSFRSPETKINELEDLRDVVQKIKVDLEELKRKSK